MAPGTGDKREQMNQSEGVFPGNANQGGRNWPCELPRAFVQSTTRPFLLRSPALGTQPAAGWALLPQLLQCSLSPQRSSRCWPEVNPTPRILGSGMGVQERKRAAAALPLAWGRHRMGQSCGGSHHSCEAVDVQGTGLLPRAAKATKQGEHPRGSLQGWVGRFLIYTPFINELAGGTAPAGIGFANTDRTGVANTAHSPGSEAPVRITPLRPSKDLVLVLCKRKG